MIIFIQKKIKRLDEVSWPQISITFTNTGLLIILKEESVECIVCASPPAVTPAGYYENQEGNYSIKRSPSFFFFYNYKY